MENNSKKSSDARIAANARYKAKKIADGTKKQINATIDSADYVVIDDFCNSHEISKAKLIVKACRDYIDRYNDD